MCAEEGAEAPAPSHGGPRLLPAPRRARICFILFAYRIYISYYDYPSSHAAHALIRYIEAGPPVPRTVQHSTSKSRASGCPAGLRLPARPRCSAHPDEPVTAPGQPTPWPTDVSRRHDRRHSQLSRLYLVGIPSRLGTHVTPISPALPAGFVAMKGMLRQGVGQGCGQLHAFLRAASALRATAIAVFSARSFRTFSTAARRIAAR
jgi:hypothetical protein